MFWLKIKAGALQLTILITVVIAVLLMAFVLLVQTHKKVNLQSHFILEMVQEANNGIQHILGKSIPEKDSLTIQKDTYKHITVHRDFWGVFEKGTSVARIKQNSFKKAALIGGSPQKTNQLALYLEDNNTPLVVVGTTRIEGLSYLPEQGVKSGSIAGQSYYGTQLIYGNIKTSGKLPQIASEVILQLTTLPKQIFKLKAHDFIAITNGKTYRNSFFDSTKIVFSKKDIHLQNVQLTGNFIVQSDTKIIVDSSTVLKDVLLIAPTIEIKEQVKGRFQAMASKSINVGKNTRLDYPSALVLHTKNTATQQSKSQLHVGKNTIIKGVVVYLGNTANNYSPQILLAENTTVFGEVYCNKNLELKGTVYGTVYANNCISKQFGSIYKNHIYNGTIIAQKRNPEYVGLLFENSKKNVLQWLY